MYEFKREDAINFAAYMHARTTIKGDELTFAECPYCHGKGSGNKNSFSISLRTGQFNCLRGSCGAQGNMLTLAQDFGFSLGTDIDEYYQPKKEFKTFKVPEKIVPKAPAIKYLDKEWCQADGKPILFGMKQCDLSNDTLIITEGQIDSLSVAEAGFTNAVSVPTGCNGFTWVPYCWDWIQNFKTIIVFGDYEKGHMTLLDDIKRRFSQLIKHVRYEDYKDCKDANAILQKYGTAQIKVCIDNAQAEPIKHIRNLSEVEVINPYDIPKIRTGIKELDALLKGGLPLGSITLVTGKAGEGKSVLASQLMLEAIDQGHKVFAYSGELTDTAFKAIATLQAGGSHCYKYQNKDGYEGYTISDSNIALIDNWINNKIFIYDDSIVEDQEETIVLTRLIEDAIKRCGVDFIIIDNLMTALELEHNGEDSKYDQQSTFVKRLARIARTFNVVLVLVAHMRKNNSNRNGNDEVAGSSDITNLAAITLMYEKDNDQRRLKVWKNRLFGYTNAEGYVMDYEEKSKRIYGAGDNPNREYGWYVPEFEPADPTALPFT